MSFIDVTKLESQEIVNNKNLIVHSNIPNNYTKVKYFKIFKLIFV